ncbi:MAG: metal ABC transporter substrate-binding protein, partial [Planctomycetota bacterium]
MSRTLMVVAFVLAILGLGACSGSGGDQAKASTPEQVGVPFRVVTTTAMIADIVVNVAGERAEATSLMGPGVDPHLYQPTRNDISRLLDADVVFYNGLNLEGKMTDTFVRVARANPQVFAVTDGIQNNQPEYLLEPPGFAGHYDPHVWMDPKGWMEATEV